MYDTNLEWQLEILDESFKNLDVCDKIIMVEGLSEASAHDLKMKAKMVNKKIGNKITRVDNKVNDFLKSIRDKFKNHARDDIIEGNLPKLSKIIKGAILIGTGIAIAPGLTAIGVLTTFAINKNTKRKEKVRILSELHKELEIVKEKIQDAENHGDKKKKYQLIRIRQKLETDIDRIKEYIY